MANQETESRSCNSPLFQALLSAEADEMLSFDAVDEAHEMAGRNHSAAISVMNASVNERLALMEASIKVVENGIANLKWTLTLAVGISTVIIAAVSFFLQRLNP